MEQLSHDAATHPPLLIVTIPEGPDLAMEGAFLAGAAKLLGLAPQWVAADFGIDEQAFQADLQGAGAVGVILPYSSELREALIPLARTIRGALDVPVALVGDGLARERVPVDPIDGVTLIAGDPGLTLLAAVGGADATAPSHERVPLDLGYLGPDLAKRALGASLFGELETVALSGGRAARSDLSPTAAFARWQAPVGDRPVWLSTELALEPLGSGIEGVGHVEWWDRHATSEVLEHARALAPRGMKQSARVRVDCATTGLLPTVKDAGIGRVVFEVDRVSGGTDLPGSTATVDDLEPWFAAARSVGLEVGVLLAVGLPGETRAAGQRRAERLLELKPDRVRCVPFEPTGGTPAWDLVHGAGMLGTVDRGLREVHRPLIQSTLSADEYWANWTDALCTLAQVEGDRTQ